MKAGKSWQVARAGIVVVLSTTKAFAHGGEDLTDATALSAWDFSLDIVIPIALAAIVYGRGMIRRAAASSFSLEWRHVSFFAGLLSFFLALQSPIDPIAERLFFVHQIQHFLLRMLGPMLLALSAPQALLISGLPTSARQNVVGPLISNSIIKGLFAFLSHPFVAALIFVASLYIWQIPRYHDFALENDPVHYVMHITMMLAGLIFWWRIFDQRPAEKGSGYGVRLMMLWIAILSNIALGAYTALKTVTLYPAYDIHGRLFGISALADETAGGIIIWIPSSMMCLIAVIIVIYSFANYEARVAKRNDGWARSNPDAPLAPTTGKALADAARPKNRAMAAGFSIFAVSIFATAILLGIMSLPNHKGSMFERDRGALEHALLDQVTGKEN